MQCFMCSHRHRGCPHLVGLLPDSTQLGQHTVKTAIISYTPVPQETYRGRFFASFALIKGNGGYPRCEEFPRLHGGNCGMCPRFTQITNAHTHTHTHTHIHTDTHTHTHTHTYTHTHTHTYTLTHTHTLYTYIHTDTGLTHMHTDTHTHTYTHAHHTHAHTHLHLQRQTHTNAYSVSIEQCFIFISNQHSFFFNNCMKSFMYK